MLQKHKTLQFTFVFLQFLFFVLPSTTIAQTADFNIMSFNIRYPNPNDGENYWEKRKDLVVSMISFHEGGLIGVQEAFRSQLDYLTQKLSNYKWVGVCRTDGSTTPNPDNEFSAILYDANTFQLLDHNTFWLSSNPDQVGSKDWDAALPRIVTWAKFKHLSTAKEFYHFNTHFDHRGKEARLKSAQLIVQQIKTIAGATPVLLTGDFNCTPNDPPYLTLTQTDTDNQLKDALLISGMPHHGPIGTWTNGFKIPGVPDRRIDFIFVKNNVEVLKHANLSDSWGGRLPSDHLPVWAKVVIK